MKGEPRRLVEWNLMKTLPVMLCLEGRLGLVVGAGKVGLRKLHALLHAGANVRLVTPAPPTGLPQNIDLRAEAYRPEHMKGVCVVFAATNDAALNHRIALDAQARNIPVNAVDQPEDCTFFSPAVAEKGTIQLAAGTGGSAPALAGLLKHRLEQMLDDHLAEFALTVGQLRKDLKTKMPDQHSQRHRILKKLVTEKNIQAFKSGGTAVLEERLKKLIEEANA